MTPAARVSAAIEILDRFLAAPESMDRILTGWARGARYAGSKDRAAVASRVYDCLRKRRSYAARWPHETGRGLVLSALTEEGASPEDITTLFDGGRFAPSPLNDAELRALTETPAPSESAAVDWPEWLWAAAGEALGDNRLRVLEALRERAPLFLRVNTLRGDAGAALALLAEDGVEAAPVPGVPGALVCQGWPNLTQKTAYKQGFVEVQDVSSQQVAMACDAAPGETVLDYCAGGGGKTLALAALMQGRGALWAHDVAPRRMKDLPDRAKRAGADGVIRVAGSGAALKPLQGKADLVLVDAPCSGSGAWRRNPDAKWLLTPERLDAVIRAQRAALSEAAQFVAPGGRLVYATCSILPVENDGAIEAFLGNTPDFEEVGNRRLFTPLDYKGDGFFVATLRSRRK